MAATPTPNETADLSGTPRLNPTQSGQRKAWTPPQIELGELSGAENGNDPGIPDGTFLVS